MEFTKKNIMNAFAQFIEFDIVHYKQFIYTWLFTFQQYVSVQELYNYAGG